LRGRPNSDLMTGSWPLQIEDMSEARTFLSSQILLALDGFDVSAGELSSVLPDPSKLAPAEKAAWIALHSWEDESALRSSSKQFQNLSFKRLRHLVRTLS